MAQNRVLGSAAPCPLCAGDATPLIWRGAKLRVVAAEQEDYPGFCRVVWDAHVREMHELDRGEREYLWGVLHVVETGLRDILEPDKINLASLGNVVPHLHWHVIPRWRDDRTFPNPIWGSPSALQDRAGIDRWRERRANAERLFATLPQLLNSTFPW